jgi:hypothetical protein
MIWGMTPEECQQKVENLEWDNSANLRKRLSGERAFPIIMSLKAPKSSEALSDISKFTDFVKVWRDFPNQHQVEWKKLAYRNNGTHEVPTKLVLNTFQDFVDFLGHHAQLRSASWQQLMEPILAYDRSLYTVLVKNLTTIEKLTTIDVNLLVLVLPQLKRDMGSEMYLRALPLIGADTKFLEANIKLFELILDHLMNGQVMNCDGIIGWLDCKENPKGLLSVRPLCSQTKKEMAGIPLLQMYNQDLYGYELPASNILVVENMQSGLALPEMADTIAVFGGGRNLTWMKANWLKSKRVGYWGDIDSWGYALLNDSRRNCAGVESIMMDESALDEHFERIVEEKTPYDGILGLLTAPEEATLKCLMENNGFVARLEQERLSSDYISTQLKKWLYCK